MIQPHGFFKHQKALGKAGVGKAAGQGLGRGLNIIARRGGGGGGQVKGEDMAHCSLDLWGRKIARDQPNRVIRAVSRPVPGARLIHGKFGDIFWAADHQTRARIGTIDGSIDRIDQVIHRLFGVAQIIFAQNDVAFAGHEIILRRQIVHHPGQGADPCLHLIHRNRQIINRGIQIGKGIAVAVLGGWANAVQPGQMFDIMWNALGA